MSRTERCNGNEFVMKLVQVFAAKFQDMNLNAILACCFFLMFLKGKKWRISLMSIFRANKHNKELEKIKTSNEMCRKKRERLN